MAKTAGFCFGVRRAVDIAEKLGRDGVKACTIGPIIHNSHVVNHLEKLGVPSVDSVEDVPGGSLAVIRSHGVAKSVYDKLAERGIEYADATCPYVLKIHKIIKENSTWNSRITVNITYRITFWNRIHISNTKRRKITCWSNESNMFSNLSINLFD